MPVPQYVIIHTAGPAWNHELPFMEQAGVMDHAGYVFWLHAEGKIERGGPFASIPGGMAILADGVTEEEVNAIVAADPGIISGLLNYEIRQWLQVMKS